jgi:5'-nucleotidase (lipoprotein e(P4) family)
MNKTLLSLLCASVAGASAALAQTPAPPAARQTLEIKWLRDSQEYASITRMVYRMATAQVTQSARGLAARSWFVTLDIDETSLDNTPYQLERAAYGIPYDSASFVGWSKRVEAGAVPGVVEFIDAVRKAGGRVAWISNRAAAGEAATRENLKKVGLWADDDKLCVAGDSARTKRVRRTETISGNGACSWGAPMKPIAYVGDQMGDFPESDEGVAGAGTDAAFGVTQFILPNPMYGEWTNRVTRIR